MPVSKNPCFRTPFDVQHVKEGPKHLQNLHESNFITFPSLQGKWIWKMSPLVIREILGVSDNTVTADGKYPLWNCENLPLPIQMKLSNKTKNFFSFFLFYFWNLNQILNFLKKKMIVRANVFPNLQTVKDLVRPLTKKHRFRTHFDSQHVKESQALEKSTWDQFYHVFHQFEENKNSTLIIFFITLRDTDLENVFVTDIWNLRGVC